MCGVTLWICRQTTRYVQVLRVRTKQDDFERNYKVQHLGTGRGIKCHGREQSNAGRQQTNGKVQQQQGPNKARWGGMGPGEEQRMGRGYGAAHKRVNYIFARIDQVQFFSTLHRTQNSSKVSFSSSKMIIVFFFFFGAIGFLFFFHLPILVASSVAPNLQAILWGADKECSLFVWAGLNWSGRMGGRNRKGSSTSNSTWWYEWTELDCAWSYCILKYQMNISRICEPANETSTPCGGKSDWRRQSVSVTYLNHWLLTKLLVLVGHSSVFSSASDEVDQQQPGDQGDYRKVFRITFHGVSHPLPWKGVT